MITRYLTLENKEVLLPHCPSAAAERGEGLGAVRQSFPQSLLALYGATDTCGDGQIPNKMSGIDLRRNF